MADVVHLHVGAPKTGTTYLQDRLQANKSLLAKHGVHYPTGARSDLFLPALDLIEWKWGGLRSDASGEWAALTRRVRRQRGTVVVSHEILGYATPAQVSRAMASFRGAEVHVVLTARDFVRQVPAEWQERVKHTRVVRFDRFVQRLRSDNPPKDARQFWRAQGVPDVLTRWGHGLPPSHVHVVTVPPPGSEPGLLWQRFARTVGIDPAWDLVDSARRNPSMGSAEATLVRRLNRRLRDVDLDPEDYRTLVRGVLAHDTLAQRDGGQPVRLDEEGHAWASAVAEEHIAWLEGSGVDVVGDLADLRPRPYEPPTGPGRGVDEPRRVDLVDAALDALVALTLEAARRRDPDDTLTTKVAKAARNRLS